MARPEGLKICTSLTTLGMQLAPAGNAHILEMPESPLLLNHVGTVHASARFALAEASSGEFLLRHLGEAQGRVFAVLRTSDVKFRKPARAVCAPRRGLLMASLIRCPPSWLRAAELWLPSSSRLPTRRESLR
jgi:hypothetical protein